MSHTAGFTYGFFGSSGVDKLYQQANVTDPASSLTAMIGKLAKLPLKHQRGTVWEYSVSVDIQGYIIEKLSGQPYDVFVPERILKPLKMEDTDFAVFGAARERLAYQHSIGADGNLVPVFGPDGREAFAKTVPGLPSPGGALYSTAGDYYWSGIFGTYFWIDPANDMIVVGMIQRAWAPSASGTLVSASYDPLYARNEAGKAIYDALNED